MEILSLAEWNISVFKQPPPPPSPSSCLHLVNLHQYNYLRHIFFLLEWESSINFVFFFLSNDDDDVVDVDVDDNNNDNYSMFYYLIF